MTAAAVMPTMQAATANPTAGGETPPPLGPGRLRSPKFTCLPSKETWMKLARSANFLTAGEHAARNIGREVQLPTC
jgi:hypothetical protein